MKWKVLQANLKYQDLTLEQPRFGEWAMKVERKNLKYELIKNKNKNSDKKSKTRSVGKEKIAKIN